MSDHSAVRSLLSPLERRVLEALATPGTRWWKAGAIANRTHDEQPRVVSALNALRRRDLVTTRSDALSWEWSITTLGQGLVSAGEQMSMPIAAGGGFRHR